MKKGKFKKSFLKTENILLKLFMILISALIVFECFKEFSKDTKASSYDMNIDLTVNDSHEFQATYYSTEYYFDSAIPEGSKVVITFNCTTHPADVDFSTFEVEFLVESSAIKRLNQYQYEIDTTDFPAGVTSIEFYVNADGCTRGLISLDLKVIRSHSVEVDLPDVTYGEYSKLKVAIDPVSTSVFATIKEIYDAGDYSNAYLIDGFTKYTPFLDAGTYTIDLKIISNTSNYSDYTDTFTHRVKKAIPVLKLEDIPKDKESYSKDDIKCTLTYIYDGTTKTVPASAYKLQYKTEGGSFSDDFPTEGGKITVRTVYLDSSFNNNLEEVSAEIDLPLKDKDPGKVKVEVSDIKYGQSPKIKIETEDYNKDNAYITYKKSGEPDENYTREVPTIPESYVVRVIFPETEKFAKYEETFKFKISKIDGTGEITAKDCYVGTKPQITVNSKNYDADKVIIEYKPSAAQDSSYTKTVPERPGTYTVRATFPENECYLKYTATTSLKLTYITSPGYSISGIKGKNNFYVSDVSIKAPAGYLISTSPETGFVNELKYSTVSQSKYVYFKEISTGALSDKVDMPVFSIDNKAPAINKKLITNGIIFKDQEEFTINDDNLDSVTVNGNPVLVTGGRASFTLLSKGGQETYEVIATDKAGNQITYSIIISAPWRETGIIPIGQKIRLERGTEYSLDEGSWTVSGDDTVYCGGMSFYATSEEEVEFTRK